MTKIINALKARRNLGQIMNEVAIKEDDYIIERAGKPLVAVISIEKYQCWENEKYDFFKWMKTVREKTKNISPDEIENAVDEAIEAVRSEIREKAIQAATVIREQNKHISNEQIESDVASAIQAVRAAK